MAYINTIMLSMRTIISENLKKLFRRVAPQYWNYFRAPEKLIGQDQSMTYASSIFVVEVNMSDPTSWVLDTGCGSHICTNDSGLKDIRTLAHGEVDLRVGNGANIAALA